MKYLFALPISMLGLFLLVRLVFGLLTYPPAFLLIIFFPISLLFDWQVALIMEAHLLGVGICYTLTSMLLHKDSS